MAYLFTGSSQYFVSNTAVATSLPLTLSCWFYASNTTTNSPALTLSEHSGVGICMLNFAGAVANDPLRATYSTSAGGVTSDTSQSYSASTWSHAAGVFTALQVSAWLNAQKTTVAGTKTFPPVTRTSVGARLANNSVSAYATGRVAECGIWNTDLSDDEVIALAKGMSPRLVRPQSLVYYAPLIRDLVDERGGLTITNNNSATVADHPRIYA